MNLSLSGIFTKVLGVVVVIAFFWGYVVDPIVFTAVMASAVRQSTPLILGALCGLLGERAGVMNIGIEGQMLFSAFIGFLVNVWTGSLVLAVIAGIAAGGFAGLLLAFMSVSLKVDQIIGGTVINIMALGITGYFYQVGMTAVKKLQPFSIPMLSKIPVIGPIFFNLSPIAFATLFLVFTVHMLLFHTPWGLRTRAVGEHPRATDTMGINVYMVRYSRVIAGGAMAGLAGAFLSLEAVGAFERGMTNGRGFIALAVMIFGKWTPIGSWGAALLFGLATALQTQLQFDARLNIPHQFIGMLPYLITIIVIAIFVGRNRPPASLGISYEKE